MYFDDQVYDLQLWEVSAHDRFRAQRSVSYAHADCCLLVFALDDATSLINLTKWRNEVLSKVVVAAVDTFPFVVAANKSDLPKSERDLSEQQISSFFKDFGMTYFETSVEKEYSMQKVFEMVADGGKVYARGLAVKGIRPDSCLLRLSSRTWCDYCEPRFRNLVDPVTVANCCCRCCTII